MNTAQPSAATRHMLTLGAVLALILFLFVSERFADGYQIQILNLIAVNTILAVSLNLIYGFTGMFSLGHAGFMAIGAYTCAILIMPPAQKEMLFLLEEAYPIIQNSHAPFFVAVLLGGVMAAVAGVIIGFPVLRLGGDYLGIATLGFAEIIRIVATNIPRVTNGALGFKGIPDDANLWWNYGWLLFTLYFIIRVVNSNFGNTLKAIRDDETAAQSMGINVFRHKMVSFTMGAFFAGIGGALLASIVTTIDPKMFLFILTFNILMIVVAGGLGSITGSVIGGIGITALLEWLRFVENPMSFGDFTINGVPGMRMLVFSLALVIIILFKQEGVMGMREFSWTWFLGLFKKNKEVG